MVRIMMLCKDSAGDCLEGGKLGKVEVLCDVEGTGIDQFLEAGAWRRFGGLATQCGGGVLGADGHDTTLLVKIRPCRACVRYVHWTLKVRGKVFFEDREVLPQRWDIGWGRVVNCVENRDEKGCGEVMDLAAQELVRIKVLKLEAAAQLPRYAHAGPFGDLAADLYAVAATTVNAGETVPVATGVAMEFPSTHGALVEDRSGLAMRGVTTLAGVIDPGYRGEIRVVVVESEWVGGRDQGRGPNCPVANCSAHRGAV